MSDAPFRCVQAILGAKDSDRDDDAPEAQLFVLWLPKIHLDCPSVLGFRLCDGLPHAGFLHPQGPALTLGEPSMLFTLLSSRPEDLATFARDAAAAFPEGESYFLPVDRDALDIDAPLRSAMERRALDASIAPGALAGSIPRI